MSDRAQVILGALLLIACVLVTYFGGRWADRGDRQR